MRVVLCDKCGEDCTNNHWSFEFGLFKSWGPNMMGEQKRHLCDECAKPIMDDMSTHYYVMREKNDEEYRKSHQ